jgi:hypothetical protein
MINAPVGFDDSTLRTVKVGTSLGSFPKAPGAPSGQSGTWISSGSIARVIPDRAMTKAKAKKFIARDLLINIALNLPI